MYEMYIPRDTQCVYAVHDLIFRVFKIYQKGSSHCGLVVTNPTSIHEDAGLIAGLTQWVKDLVLP